MTDKRKKLKEVVWSKFVAFIRGKKGLRGDSRNSLFRFNSRYRKFKIPLFQKDETVQLSETRIEKKFLTYALLQNFHRLEPVSKAFHFTYFLVDLKRRKRQLQVIVRTRHESKKYFNYQAQHGYQVVLPSVFSNDFTKFGYEPGSSRSVSH